MVDLTLGLGFARNSGGAEVQFVSAFSYFADDVGAQQFFTNDALSDSYNFGD